jgi:hypothetical protein
MPKHATARIEDMELRMREPASAEEMARREELAEMILALMDRPTTEEEREFWREFQADLARDRPKFR